MACYHPNKALWYGEYNLTGKKKYEIVGQNVNSYGWLNRKHNVIEPYEITEIPCGKCIGCKLAYSQEWAIRCMLEAKKYKDNAFITLTYSDEYIPKSKGVNLETGEIIEQQTLLPDDLKKFMKDLRRYYKYHYDFDNIRFYACGEYGSTTHRPHYHLILFNLPIQDKELLFINSNHEKIFDSQIIRKIWGKGHIGIGEVNEKTVAYTARYVMKKQTAEGKDKKQINELLGLVPEFTRCSRRGGIGKDYFDENKTKIYQNDEIIITTKEGIGKAVKPSKYYDRLYDLECPEAMKAIKEKRKQIAENSMKLQLERTSLNKQEYLEVKERNKINQIKNLVRNAI